MTKRFDFCKRNGEYVSFFDDVCEHDITDDHFINSHYASKYKQDRNIASLKYLRKINELNVSNANSIVNLVHKGDIDGFEKRINTLFGMNKNTYDKKQWVEFLRLNLMQINK